jgi:hypothetical protein
MEATLAKVDKLDTLMNRIANQLGLLQDLKYDTSQPDASTPAPHQLPASVSVLADQPAPISQLDPALALLPPTSVTPTDGLPFVEPDGVRPLTYVGTPSHPETPPKIRKSLVDTFNADASMTGVGQADRAPSSVQEDG